MSQITSKMPAKLLDFLNLGRPAILATQDEAGWPHLVMTWAVARDEQTIRFIVDFNTTSSANLGRSHQASLQVIGSDNVLFLIKGQARQIKERVEAATFAIVMMELAVANVKDQSWPIVEVSPLTYEWVADKREEFTAMEQAILAELREWELA